MEQTDQNNVSTNQNLTHFQSQEDFGEEEIFSIQENKKIDKVEIAGDLPAELIKLTEKLPSLLRRVNSYLEKPTTSLGLEQAQIKERGLFYDVRDIISEFLVTTRRRIGQETLKEGNYFTFDPKTSLLGIIRRLPILFVFLFLAIVISFIGIKKFTKTEYKAETILLYKDILSIKKEGSPTLRTQIEIVKIRENLEAVLKKLSLTCSIDALDNACVVELGKRTDLMTITTVWENPTTAANITNTLKDVFLERQISLQQEKIKKEIDTLEKFIHERQNQLDQTKAGIEKEMEENYILDLEKEIELNFDTLSSLQSQYENVLVEQQGLLLQVNVLIDVIKELEKMVLKEKMSEVQLAEYQEVTQRITQLRQQIDDDKKFRADTATLEQKRVEYERAKRLKEQGLIADTNFKIIETEYEKQKAITETTSQIDQWKGELEKLLLVPSPNSSQLPSEEILLNMRTKAYDIELTNTANQGKIRQLEIAIKNTQKRLEVLVRIRKKQVHYEEQTKLWETDKVTKSQQLSELLISQQSINSGFDVLSEALPPSKPTPSSFRILFPIITLLFGAFFGFSFICILELLDTTIKSKRELELKVNYPVLETIPKLSKINKLEEVELIESARTISRKLRYFMPKENGGRFALLSTIEKEGKTTILFNLAACLNRQGSSVLLINTNLRSTKEDFQSLLPPNTQMSLGLGDYLSGNTTNFEEILSPTLFPQIKMVGKGCPIEPDLLGSRSMEHLLELASQEFQIILLDGPPTIPYIDGELIVQHIDGIIFVLESRKCKIEKIRKALKHLRETRTPIIGIVLNKVSSWYMEKID